MADPGAASGVERTLQVVFAIAASEQRDVGVSELSRVLGLPKAVVHRILKALTAGNFLAFDDRTRRYSLGPGALTVGLAAVRSLEVPVVARPHLTELVAQTGETATLSVRQEWTRIYVDQVLSPREVRMSVPLGRPFPLHLGSSSKAILSALPDAELARYLECTPYDGDRAALAAEIAAIRQRGYALSRGERQPGAASVAAAISRNGTVFGSMSVCGPDDRFDAALMEEYGQLLVGAVRRLTNWLTGRTAG